MKEIKQNHTESNPLYELTLDEIAEQVKQTINVLNVSGLHTSNWHVFRAHKILGRLYFNLERRNE